MPELPEVETVTRGIEPWVTGKTILNIVVRNASLRWPVAADLAEQFTGRKISAVSRRSKYIVLHCGDKNLLIHLGMTGRVFILPKGEVTGPKKHDHLDFELSSGAVMRFHDPRRFGAIVICDADINQSPLIAHLGPEPLTDHFSGDYLFKLSRKRTAPVKSFLMDGRVVVGVGNIYASESLFRAAIKPKRAAGKVTRAEYGRLVEEVRDVLTKAIAQGGTTLKDFAGADGAPGYFQQELFVYGRENQPCARCQTPIKKLVIGQRSSFFCTRCQK